MLYLSDFMEEIKHISPNTPTTAKDAEAALSTSTTQVERQSLSKFEKDQVFEQEFMPHLDALFNFAYHLTYNESDADDLVQETCMKAYRFAGSYIVGTNAKAWLFKILKNAFINTYRKKSKRPTKVDYEEVINYHGADGASYVEFVDLRHEIFEGMMGDEVTIALNSLPVDFKTVVLLCDIEGFTYEEMAVIIDIPIGTVRSRLHRARKMLKQELLTYAQKMGYNTSGKK